MPENTPYPDEGPDKFMQRMMNKRMGKKSGGMKKAAGRFMLTQAQKLQKENKEAEKY